MSTSDVLTTLHELRDFAQEAAEIATGRTRADLDQDRGFRRHAERIVELIGEAANRLPEDVQAQYPAVPWRQIIGMRNWLAHGYDGVDYEIVWDVLATHAPALVKEVEAILKARAPKPAPLPEREHGESDP
jgi:uncharacterized protein with HEPN domain